MRWALNTYRTAQNWTLEETLEMAKKTGYHGVEWLMDFQQGHGIEWDLPRQEWSAKREAIRRSGLQSASLTSCQVFHHPDPEQRAESVRRVRRVIEMAEYFEAPMVRVLGDRFTPETREQVIQWVAEALRELGEYAASRGILLNLEMHGSFTDPEAALAVVQRVNLPNVGFVFNGQFVGCEPGGSIAPLFERIAPYVRSVHTHQVEDPTVFGFYQQMFRWLRRSGFEGWISNECAYTGPDPEKVLRLYVALFEALSADS
ncbi:MAG: hypothetical protein KatS3mg115_1077 [Candidatus Poribacteria bacterium]|nr:MAG: hypothetical protein KatS3mg115_1077 [Candidatus Poribacteria bacterium]